MKPNFKEILPLLAHARVKFIGIGGGAAIAHGSARATYDVDVVYARDGESINRLVRARKPFDPYLREHQQTFPFNGMSRR